MLFWTSMCIGNWNNAKKHCNNFSCITWVHLDPPGPPDVQTDGHQKTAPAFNEYFSTVWNLIPHSWLMSLGKSEQKCICATSTLLYRIWHNVGLGVTEFRLGEVLKCIYTFGSIVPNKTVLLGVSLRLWIISRLTFVICFIRVSWQILPPSWKNS